MTQVGDADSGAPFKSTETVTGIRPASPRAPSLPPVGGNAPTFVPPPLGVAPPKPAGLAASVPPPSPAGRVTTAVGLCSPRSAPPPLPADALRRASLPPSVTPSVTPRPSFVPPSAALRSSVPPPPPPPRRDDSRELLVKAQGELRALRQELDRLREQGKQREAELAGARAQLEEQGLQLTTLRGQLAQAAQAAPVGDDLKRIRGVGPGFERTLKQAGVERFAQIAAWSVEDVARIAQLLNTQPTRIERADWVGQARALAGG